ncbi:hypothetical protein Tco_0449011 [Tanacetum coccineum]
MLLIAKEERGQELIANENDFIVDINDKGEQIEENVVFMERLEKMKAFEAEHVGVTKDSVNDSQLIKDLTNKVHYETKCDSDSNQDRLIHEKDRNACLEKGIHDMLKQEFLMVELINSSASEMEIPGAVKKPLKRCLYTVPSRVARPQDRSVPKMNRVSLPPTEVVSKTRKFNALNKNCLLQKDECNNVKYVVLIAYSSKKKDVSNSMNVVSVSNACNSLKCNVLDDILTRKLSPKRRHRKPRKPKHWVPTGRILKLSEICPSTFLSVGKLLPLTIRNHVLLSFHILLLLYVDYLNFSMIPRREVDKGIGHNLFNIRQFCDSGMKVALDSRNRTLAYSLEQMGVVERRNHTLMEATRTMLTSAKLPIFIWAEKTSEQSSSGLVHNQGSSTSNRYIPSPDNLVDMFEKFFDDPAIETNQRMSPNSAATLLPNSQEDIPSPVFGSSTTTLNDDESTPDTPLVSQESSKTATLPSAFNNKVDDQHKYVVPLEVNSFMNPFVASRTDIGKSSQARYVDPYNEHTHYQPYPRSLK